MTDDAVPAGNVRVVATAMKLSEAARAHLAEAMGPGAVVLDLNDAPESTEVVIAPMVSPQLIGILKERFPHARVLLAEVTDDEFGVKFGGPVQRAMDAGADGYLVADDLDQLARVTEQRLALGDGLEGHQPQISPAGAETPPRS